MDELLKYYAEIIVRRQNANTPDSKIIIMADFSAKDREGFYNYPKIHARGKTYGDALKRAVHLVSSYAEYVNQQLTL